MQPFWVVPLDIEALEIAGLEALANKVDKGKVVERAVQQGLSDNGALCLLPRGESLNL